ncbi:MAG: MFS family permease [Hyphomicrobiaceae bacterium]|jgi:MFS family permease
MCSHYGDRSHNRHESHSCRPLQGRFIQLPDIQQNDDGADQKLMKSADADKSTFNASMMLTLALPADTVLYLLLPIHAVMFGVSLPEVGILLAANRLVRIAGYSWVAQFYADRGPRAACLLAAIGSVIAALGYALLSGLWALLAARLIWGLSFAAMNIAVHALPTAELSGVARRSGWSRSIIACGPMIGLAGGALIAYFYGPRVVFLALAAIAVAAVFFAMRLPTTPEQQVSSGPRFAKPGPMSIWSFCMGFTLDGLFIFGLALLAKENVPEGAVIAAGFAMALRYLFEITLSPVGGWLSVGIGARRLLIILSILAAGGLLLLGLGSPWMWIGVIAVITLRALLQPLPAPVVAESFPGAARVPALARQATWRDIGAGTGPLAAGLLFPVFPALAIYTGGAALLALSSVWMMKRPD